MFAVHLFVIYVLLREITLVSSADDLEFWTGSPAYNGRRENKNNNYRRPSDESKIKFRYSKINPITRSHHNNKSTTTRSHMLINTFEKLEKTKTVQNRDNINDYKRPRAFADTDIDKESSKWPKVKAHRFKQKTRKGAVRSTRMTPVYLLQQPAEKITTKKRGKYTDETPKVLSPYSIKKQMIEFCEEFPQANISVEVIGRTVEYNDIVMLKITEKKSEIGRYFRADESKYIDEVPEKKIIFIVHGLQIMGWSMLKCLSRKSYLKDLVSFYFAHLDKFDIFLIPLANPDGSVFQYRIWNKNMSPQGACPGVALDRNFDVAWNTTMSVSSCSQHFPGLAPFSEPETKAIRDVLHHYSHKIHAYINVHGGSYMYDSFKGDAVLYPKGYTDVQSDDDKYIDLRGEIDEAIKNASFQVISVAVDTLHNWYGQVSGSSVDYASTIYGIPYSLELVMQPYKDDYVYGDHYSDFALHEIWKRVIDVIFNNIWRNLKNNEI